MADETHKLQKDPPEGSRKVIDHELERQSEAAGGAGDGGAAGSQGKDRREPGSDGSKGRAKG